MKAVTQNRYGEPGVLKLELVAMPQPGEGEVLVRVEAASLHRGDAHLLHGTPYPIRLGYGLRRPRHRIPGMDVAGVIEAVGGGVTGLDPGDEVFGFCHGALAEFACAEQRCFAPKPGNVTFAQAAAVPVSGIAALQALRDHGRIEAGQKLLVVGASGGVGTFAVQLGKVFGAHVTGVCGTSSMELVRSLGADQVIDYTLDDFTRTGLRYDLIVDMAGTRPLRACRRALTYRGTYVAVGGPSGQWLTGLDRPLKALVLTPFVPQRLRPMISRENLDDLLELKVFIEAGTLAPVVSRHFTLAEAPTALAFVERGHTGGKVVVTI